MPKNVIETHVVEFWTKPSNSVDDKEEPQSTLCADAQSAIALEASFHAIGWPARALTLQTHVDRLMLTSRTTGAATKKIK